MVSPNDTGAVHDLAGSLDEALSELARLDVTVESERRGAAAWLADRLIMFSPGALDRLYAVVRDGREAIARRAREIAGGKFVSSESATATPSGRIAFPASAEPVTLATTAEPAKNEVALFVAYRTCARALCAAILEARRVSDATTAAVLSRVVHRLEKQLWLLDSARTSPRIGFSTISLFLSC